MAGNFRIAEGFVEVTADESGYNRAMERLKSRKNTVDVKIGLIDGEARASLDRFLRERSLKVKVDLDNSAFSRLRFQDLTVNLLPKISEAAERTVRTKLDRLTADRVVQIRANVDTRVGANEIANLTRRRTVTIGTDVNTRVAADDLANLTRRRTVQITANADTAAAAARLALLSRDRHVNIRADVDRGAASRISSMFSGALSGVWSLLKGSVTNLVAVSLEALPALASLGASVAAMAPAAAIAVPAVLSLGAAFAAIKIGTSGVGDALKAAFAPAASSANSAASATHRVEDAQRSLAKAQQGVKDAEVRAAEARVQAARQIEDAQRSLKSTVQDVADANRRAAQQVASAERDLTDAQRDAKQAQLDLTAARKQAAQELQDLNDRLADAQLDQRQKVLDLQDAEQELAAVKAKGAAASKEEVDKAQLQYDRAVQGLSEQQTETARLQQQADDANKAGVEGSKTVADAKKSVSDATTDVSDKTRALKDAETDQARATVDGLQKVAAAERAVADAREGARKAAVDGARQIADANASVADAARNLTDAQTAGAAAVSKTADALAKLAPNARSFVAAVVAQAGAWRALKLDVQNTLFAGLGQKFTTMSGSILPSLKTGLTGTAGVLNTMAKGAFDAVTNLGKAGTLRQMFAGLNAGLKPLSKIPGQFITGLAQISVAASPAFKRLTTAAGGAADGIAKKLSDAFKSGRLEGAINGAVEIAKQFGHLIGDIFGTLGNVMKAAGAAGGDALGALGSVFKELRRITALPEVQKALTSIFKALADVGKLLAGALGSAIQAVLPLLAQLAPFVSALAKQLGPVVGQLLGTLGKALGPIMNALMPILGDVGKLLIDLVKAVMPLLKPIGELLGEVIKAVGPFLKLFGDNLTTIVGGLVKYLVPVIKGLIPAVGQFGEMFAQMAPMFAQLWPALMPLIPPLAKLTVSLLTLAMQVITPLMPLIVELAKIFTTVLVGAIRFLVPVISGLIDWITSLSDYAAKGVHAIVEGFKWLWKTAKELFTAGKNWVTSTWNSLWNGARSKWDSFWSGLKSMLSGAWNTVKNGFSSVKTTVTNTWNSLWNGTRDKVTSIFSTISSKMTSFKNGVKSTFTTLRDNLGSIWDGIKSKLAAPVKWVISHVYNEGIRKMWNSIAGKISSKITLPPVPLKFSTGGVVPGKRSNKDSVPAMLAPGERVLSNSQVDQLGGHRGIDAILGKDHPTGTGGNPTSAQERKRHQPAQGFVDGGILGKVTSAVGGAVSGVASWTKDVVIGGLKSAAQKALSALVRPLINQIPGSGIGGLMRGLSNKAVDGMLSWFTGEDKKAVGGPAVQKALAWVKTQAGKPYQWAGNGNPSFDCSGLVSAVESVIRGESPHRRWATGAFGSSAPAGWVRNLNSPFMIGITNAGVGHTAGTLAGTNIESRGGDGIVVGKRARGYNDSLFTSRWGFAPATKYDSGGLLQPGATMAVNKTGKPEAVLTAEEHAAFREIVTGLHAGGAGAVTIEKIEFTVNSLTMPSDAEKRKFATDMVRETKEALRKYEDSRRR
ncbi:hypothetical protein [Streptomyces fagopyri]|uniref:hypothetical protein n=1 Tax=Streptomyces fagopyri TaxID=2662397 RepID=UPI0037196C3A